MTTLRHAPPHLEPTGLGPRVTEDMLERLAGRVLVDGVRDPLEVHMPASDEQLGQVPRCTPADVVSAAARARAAQPAWADVPVTERTEILLRFATLVLARQEEILDLIQLESGKARRHAFEEIIDVAQVGRYYARTAPRLLRPQRKAGAIPGLTRTCEYHHPKGVVGIISPWNYPLTLGVTDALPALVAGNAVVAKPDQQTPFTALWAAALLEEAGLPPGVLQVVTGTGAELGDAIVDNSDFVMFTGSTRVGRAVAARAAHRLVDFSMELGGKNAILILEDAELGKAVPGAIRGAFSNTGQLCISFERMFVVAAIWEDFVPRFVEATRGLRLGHALDYGPDVGTLVSARQLATVQRHVDDAVAKGATVLAGGRARPELGPYFYEPTVLTDVRPDMDVCAEETFGPVVSLYRVEGTEEAIRGANDSSFGLNFSVWTGDALKGREVATRLHAGTVNVNDAYAAAWGSVDAPMGGWKDSGMGRRHGDHGLLKYTESQTIAVERLAPIGPPPFMSAELYARVMTKAMQAMQRLPGRK
ncbi:MAG TPA: succinic semialdehyde dehydrogenase [Acidimicrobiales bacterium]|nr:succinic semialdehyde dehydrogenase [Acidimicrobiales bacterium]